MDIQYLGESTFPGQLGHFLAILSFVAALVAAISYTISVHSNSQADRLSWRNFGRIFFGIHGISVVSVIVIIFYLMITFKYEYYYVWQHSSEDLPFIYQFSAFWEGQEGSFLLWTFWHVVIGAVLIRSAKKWEAPVMAVVAVVQIFLASMILGIYLFEYKLGSTPFILLREMFDYPVFQRADYLDKIQLGQGLNPLLQNYWMVIHPPTLFLGFALTLVPFAYAIAGLWTRQLKEWTQPVLPWVVAGGMVLGIGILMGGAWAYEALSFGGFWAWDPVENASLVPWLILIAGMHTLLAFRHSGHALISTYLFLTLSFLLVLYSTFLTRSGILGDTSVHSFTDLGMSGQLMLYMLVFVVLAAVLLIINWKRIPRAKAEEAISSREFWLFIGAIVFLISAVQITVYTSMPVFNKVASLEWINAPLRAINSIIGSETLDKLIRANLAPPSDTLGLYNKFQLPVAVIIGLLSAVGLYFKYKRSSFSELIRKLSVPLIIAVLLTVIFAFGSNIYEWYFLLLLFAGLFAICANLYHIIAILKGNLKLAGSALSHFGFGIFLVGILISQGKQEVISLNTMGFDYGEGFDDQSNRENILLQINRPVQMSDYRVTYKGDSVIPPDTYLKVLYEKVDETSNEVKESFYLYPHLQINPEMGPVPNPDTRHYLTKDVFTHVTAMKLPDEKDRKEEKELQIDTVSIGDTIFTSNSFVIAEELIRDPAHPELSEGDIAVGMLLKVKTLEGKEYEAKPIFVLRENRVSTIQDKVTPLGLEFSFLKIYPETNEFEIGTYQDESVNDYIIMKAIVFPFINLVWLGSILLFLGFMISLTRRIKENKRRVATSQA